jgi:hypothetical protein
MEIFLKDNLNLILFMAKEFILLLKEKLLWESGP